MSDSVGIVIGVLAGVLFLGLVIYAWRRWNNREYKVVVYDPNDPYEEFIDGVWMSFKTKEDRDRAMRNHAEL